jgi:hypothetical protein
MSTSRGDAIRRLRPVNKRTRRDEFAELREHIESLPVIGRRISVRRLLDFHDKAVAALRKYETMTYGPLIDFGHEAREVLADLDKEI